MPNVPKNISNIIEEFISGVNEILGDRVKKIILYGSYARGDYNKNSDIDLNPCEINITDYILIRHPCHIGMCGRGVGFSRQGAFTMIVSFASGICVLAGLCFLGPIGQ